MNNLNLAIYGLVAVIIVAIIGFSVTSVVRTAGPQATIITEVTPSDATIVINNTTVTEGEISVSPGNYNVEIKRDGFNTQTRSLTVKEDETAKVAVSLDPSGPEASQYYQNNPEEARKAEGIGGQISVSRGEAKIQETPIIRQLPRVEAGKYRIDYGISTEQPDNPDAVAIIITPYNEAGRKSAINWLKYRGYDDTNTEISFKERPGGS